MNGTFNQTANQTFLNGTSNQTGLNDTDANLTLLNLTSNQTLLNATVLEITDDLEGLALLKEKFRLKSALKFKSVKKRIVEINGTNETRYDLSFTITSGKKKRNLPKNENQQGLLQAEQSPPVEQTAPLDEFE